MQPSSWANGLRRDLRLNGQLYLLIAPVVIGFIVFRFVPLTGLVIAFKDYNFVDGLWNSPWVGLENFEKLFKDPFFGRVVVNTFVLGALSLAVNFPLPIVLALALNEVRHTRFKRTIQSLTYLPHFVPIVVIAGLLIDLFSGTGLVNHLLILLGLKPVQFLSSVDWFRPIYLLSDIWPSVGWSAIFYFAAISTISVDLYEAAKVDGASRLQQIRYITLPGILPVMIILFILNVGAIARVGFERAYFLQQPITYSVSDVLETYIYRRGILGADYSYAAAVGLINSFVVLVMVGGANWIISRSNDERRGLW